MSKPDARKWDFEEGSYVIIIGGQSRKSRMIEVSEGEAYHLKRQMRKEGRDTAVEQLRKWDYEPGSSGLNHSNYDSPQAETEALKIKRLIDNGKREPDYDDIFRVACRLLKTRGWEGAWGWIKRTFGDDFKPQETYSRLRLIVEQYNTYNHVEVPPEPDSAIEESEI